MPAVEGREQDFLGGVVGSCVLLDEACVGRIMRAKKPSSTSFAFLGASRAGLAGGGPMLGRDRVACLAGRPVEVDECALCRLVDCREDVVDFD